MNFFPDGNTILWKRGEIASKAEQFLLFSTIVLIYARISNLRSQLHIHFWNVVIRFILFLNSTNSICRGTDISKYFRSPLDFEITRVDCSSNYIIAVSIRADRLYQTV